MNNLSLRLVLVGFLSLVSFTALADGPVFDITDSYVGESDTTEEPSGNFVDYTSPGGDGVADDYIPSDDNSTSGEPGVDDTGNVGE